jgi:hypothetical protein
MNIAHFYINVKRNLNTLYIKFEIIMLQFFMSKRETICLQSSASTAGP